MDFPSIAPATGTVGAWPTHKEALGLYEFFSPGTRTDVILLGEPIKVTVHHIKSKRHKILCTASTGSCEACQVCGTSVDVSNPQVEYHAPAMRMKKDRKHWQCIAVFSEKQFEEQLSVLISEEGARGLRVEVWRSSTQKCDIKPVKGSPRTLSMRLPEAFLLLPWARARWCLHQDAAYPAVRLEPFTVRDVDHNPGRAVKALELTSDDRLSADEWEKTKAKLAEMRAKAAEPVKAPAPPPAAAAPSGFVTVSPPASNGPVSKGAPEQTPPPAAPTKIVLVPVPAPDPGAVERNLAQRHAADVARRASLDPTDRKDSLAPITGVLDVLTSMFLPGPNGKHAAKGGAL